MKPRALSSCRKSDFTVLMGAARRSFALARACISFAPRMHGIGGPLGCRLFLLLDLAEPLVEIGVDHLHEPVHTALEEVVGIGHGRMVDDDALLRLEPVPQPPPPPP